LESNVDEDVVVEDVRGFSEKIGIEKDVLGAILSKVEIDRPIDCFQEFSRGIGDL
jgi:hypothetical protein